MPEICEPYIYIWTHLDWAWFILYSVVGVSVLCFIGTLSALFAAKVMGLE